MRTLFGYAVLAIIAFFALKLGFGLLGFAFSLFWNVLWLAGIGFVAYLVIKLVSPSTAARIHDAITGKRLSDR
ncbi:MAG: hypothetical protein Q8W45_00620 [Candidatus Palauibacterales bacterium]|nr:hypothetical protein [Candidatus Palauibacterales bacterium]